MTSQTRSFKESHVFNPINEYEVQILQKHGSITYFKVGAPDYISAIEWVKRNAHDYVEVLGVICITYKDRKLWPR